MYTTLISIIIPVYNAEKTIERCIHSFRTEERDIEIICIDDGSNDRSGELLDKLQEKDRRLKVIHQKNAGAAAARNVGVKNASGKYIMFCDADDAYMPDTIPYIKEDIIENEPDYIVFKRIVKIENETVTYWGNGNNKCFLECTWDEYLNHIIMEHQHGSVVYTKAYKKELIDLFDVKFEESLLFSEDLWFNVTYLFHAKTFLEDFRAAYCQYKTAGSICQSRHDDFFKLNTECIYKLKKQFPQESAKIQEFIYKFIFNSGIQAIHRTLVAIDGDNKAERKDICKKVLQYKDFRKSVHYVNELPENTENKYMKKKAKVLLRYGINGYTFRFYFLPKIKRTGCAKLSQIFRKKC